MEKLTFGMYLFVALMLPTVCKLLPLDLEASKCIFNDKTSKIDCFNCSLREVPNFPDQSKWLILVLSENGITELDVGVFDSFINLHNLFLDRNNISSLPLGIFDSFLMLGILNLNHNKLTSLPSGIFDTSSRLRLLFIHNNLLNDLPEGIFNYLEDTVHVELHANMLSSLPTRLFDQILWLDTLKLGNNMISTLSVGLFDVLVNLQELQLGSNKLTHLMNGTFDSLKDLNILGLEMNQLSTLPSGIFDSLRLLMILLLHGNKLESIPPGIFDIGTWLSEVSLPFLCNCSEQRIYLLQFIRNSTITSFTFYDNGVNVTSKWIHLARNCNATWIDYPYCRMFELFSVQGHTSEKTATVVVIAQDIKETHEGIVYTLCFSLFGAAVSSIILYFMSANIGKVIQVVRNEKDLTSLIVDELLDYDRFYKEMKRLQCNNVPPLSTRMIL